jgi:hypothetical protein
MTLGDTPEIGKSALLKRLRLVVPQPPAMGKHACRCAVPAMENTLPRTRVDAEKASSIRLLRPWPMRGRRAAYLMSASIGERLFCELERLW